MSRPCSALKTREVKQGNMAKASKKLARYAKTNDNMCPLMSRLIARNAATRWGHTHQDNWLLRAAAASKRHMAANAHSVAFKSTPPLTWACCEDGNQIWLERKENHYLP